ncbi:flagellar basal body P-ring formation chaperone FlgA [Roseovarius sp. 217]|jgi:flagella basal body P-ring formation protein FlgA|uniref:flagellar basal body P-ring formation chaperone FlgA n=1 Tax=Roseovarius sp. (strain 217) TaxID=314264 RepID=UPI0000687DA9|nr:putative flagellar basal-body P-ring formation protein FlgA [Roseovarius sp. 217]
MMRFLTSFLMLIIANPALADMVVATRTIRAQEVLGPADLLLKPGEGISDVTLHDLIGQEVRVALYPGRQIRAVDVGPPTVIERNQIVPLVYAHSGLRIETEGRSLSRAGVGDYVRVMNLASRATVSGRVTQTGHILVSR